MNNAPPNTYSELRAAFFTEGVMLLWSHTGPGVYDPVTWSIIPADLIECGDGLRW